MKIKTSITGALILIQTFVGAQGPDNKKVLEDIFNSLLQQNIIATIIYDYPSCITPYQFDGDYSLERIFPNAPATMKICFALLAYESSIHNILKSIDSSYDSGYFQKQIHESIRAPWSTHGLEFQTEIKFTKSWLLSPLRSGTGIISYPLFSKDGQTAVITYYAKKGRSSLKQPQKIYILRKRAKEWIIKATINSKEY